jgi:hypothetical protein
MEINAILVVAKATLKLKVVALVKVEAISGIAITVILVMAIGQHAQIVLEEPFMEKKDVVIVD